MIVYQRIKGFPEDQIARLFLLVGWQSGEYPKKLVLAFKNSSRVISAWDQDQLIGLIRGLDDGVWQAKIDCLLVDPAYQQQGIGSALLSMLLEEYRHFMYVDVVPDDKRNVPFYQRHGFQIADGSTAMQIKKSSRE